MRFSKSVMRLLPWLCMATMGACGTQNETVGAGDTIADGSSDQGVVSASDGAVRVERDTEGRDANGPSPGDVRPELDGTHDADGTDGDSFCGDGVLNAGEACDNGLANSDTRPDACRADCQFARCGDGVTDSGERCDDGDSIDGNACSNECAPVLSALCQPCASDADCGRFEDRCVALNDGRYCAMACTGDDGCPAGFECADVADSAHLQCIPDTGGCTGCLDPDGDGYGIGAECLGLDCDELSPASHAGAQEVCDGVDNDCDGDVDDGSDRESYWLDGDRDGYGAAGTSAIFACTAPAGYAGNDDDCDDTRDDVAPGVDELCDGIDNDCDSLVDNGAVCECDAREYNGKIYLFCDSARNWVDARDYCISRGYDLVTIETAAENSWLGAEYGSMVDSVCTDTCSFRNDGECDDGGPGSENDLCAYATDCGDCGGRVPSSRHWIGLNDRAVENVFVWQSGSRSAYRNWRPLDLTGDSLVDDCAQFDPSDLLWYRDRCDDRTIPFVCESR